jgi:hypothetical protein
MYAYLCVREYISEKILFFILLRRTQYINCNTHTHTHTHKQTHTHTHTHTHTNTHTRRQDMHRCPLLESCVIYCTCKMPTDAVKL